MSFSSLARLGFLTILFVGLSSCSSLKSRKAMSTFKSDEYAISQSEEVSSNLSAIRRNPNSLLAKTSGRLDLIYSKKDYQFWIEYFTKRAPKTFNAHMANAYEVKETVQKILADNGVPIEVFYLGLIESGYNTKIKSRAQATGPWQFMKGTAVRYGLRVDKQVDERYNIHKSTEAAARYLVDLYNIFGSWELAFCGYNAGEYRVINAIRKGNSRDYRELVSQGLLPKETVLYIPKIVAARDIFLHPQRYGMNYEKRNGDIYEQVIAKDFDRSLGLKTLSHQLDVSRGTLVALNPDLKEGKIQLKKGEKIRLYLPQNVKVPPFEKSDLLAFDRGTQKYRSFKYKDRKPASLVVKAKQRFKIYVANKKEKIADVARRHGINQALLAKVNGLKESINHQLKPGQRLRIPI